MYTYLKLDYEKVAYFFALQFKDNQFYT
jgi:hypothetical protein